MPEIVSTYCGLPKEWDTPLSRMKLPGSTTAVAFPVLGIHTPPLVVLPSLPRSFCLALNRIISWDHLLCVCGWATQQPAVHQDWIKLARNVWRPAGEVSCKTKSTVHYHKHGSPSIGHRWDPITTRSTSQHNKWTCLFSRETRHAIHGLCSFTIHNMRGGAWGLPVSLCMFLLFLCTNLLKARIWNTDCN